MENYYLFLHYINCSKDFLNYNLEIYILVQIVFKLQACRWSLLITGIFYGIYNHNKFSKREAMLREIEERERPAREAKLAQEKKIRLAGNSQIFNIFNLKVILYVKI